MKQVLIADDHGEVLAACLEAVNKDGRFKTTTAENPRECMKLFNQGHFDAVVLDLSFTLGNKEGLNLITEIKSKKPETSVIVLSSMEDSDTMLEAVDRGADRFLTKKHHDVNQIAEKINQVLDSKENDDQHTKEGAEIAQKVGAVFHSKALQDIFGLVAKARSCRTKTVHIVGETGVGKELIAKAIGNLVNEDGPFVSLNCAAIPKELIEGELFGYKKGAFTNATRDYKGRFLEANHGTIFLDEVACLSSAAQKKLLRVLQEKVVTPLGSSDVIPLNIRVVSATNAELEELVNEGVFRSDLKARLMGIRIDIPPLRERLEDIDPIIDFTIANSDSPNIELDPECRILFREYAWPENARQLVETVDTMISISNGQSLTAADISDNLRKKMKRESKGDEAQEVSAADVVNSMSPSFSLDEAKEKFTKLYIEKVVANLGISATKMGLAKELQVSRNTIKKYLKEFSIDLPGD